MIQISRSLNNVEALINSIAPLLDNLDSSYSLLSERQGQLHSEIQNDRILNSNQLKVDFASLLLDTLNINEGIRNLQNRISSIVTSALSMLVEVLSANINGKDDTPVATRNRLRHNLARIVSILQNPLLRNMKAGSIADVSSRGEVMARLATSVNRNYFRIRDYFKSIRKLSYTY